MINSTALEYGAIGLFVLLMASLAAELFRSFVALLDRAPQPAPLRSTTTILLLLIAFWLLAQWVQA
mgnify:CR=1 FL=1